MPVETIVFIAICLLTGICTFIVARPAKQENVHAKEQPTEDIPRMLVGSGGNLTCEYKSQIIEVDQSVCIYLAEVRLLCAGRGDDAYRALRQVNTYNAPPAPGKEYLMAMLEVTVKSIRFGTGPVSISPFDAECLRQNGQLYERKNIIAPHPVLRGDLQPGMALAGWVAFEIDQNDPCPQIVFGQDYTGNGGARFSLVPVSEKVPVYSE